MISTLHVAWYVVRGPSHVSTGIIACPLRVPEPGLATFLANLLALSPGTLPIHVRKDPLVLYIHGGPHSQYNEGWFDEFQNIAGAGMWVLFTNPRGSSGYGADFTYSTRGRWGAEDYEDIMKAVDIAAARPDVDSTRMGVTGGS